jgi:hypothetical protein
MTLKATQAREVDRRSVTDPEIVVLDGRAHTSSPEMQAGDFYLRPNYVPQEVRRTFFDRLFRRHPVPKTQIINTVVISCPFCGLPILTNFSHKILSRDPLTLEKPITCPYRSKESQHAFQINQGEIIPVNA